MLGEWVVCICSDVVGVVKCIMETSTLQIQLIDLRLARC